MDLNVPTTTGAVPRSNVRSMDVGAPDGSATLYGNQSSGGGLETVGIIRRKLGNSWARCRHRYGWLSAYMPVVSSEEGVKDPNADVDWGDNPTEFSKCPYCGLTDTVSYTQHESSCATYFFCLMIFIFLGWAGIFVIMFCHTVLQDVKHHCPGCHNVVKTRGRIRCPQCSNDVFTIEIAGCALVLSKRYGMIFGALLGTVLCFWYVRSLNTEHWLLDVPHENGIDLDSNAAGKWENFLLTCGYKKALGNPLRATRTFDEIYRNNNVEWTGRIAKIREGFQFLLWTAPGLIKIEMHPSENTRDADLMLLFNPNLENQVAELELLDRVTFRGTLLSLGKRGSPHVLQLWKIVKHEHLDEATAQNAENRMKHSDKWYTRGADVWADLAEDSEENVIGSNIQHTNVNAAQMARSGAKSDLARKKKRKSAGIRPNTDDLDAIRPSADGSEAGNSGNGQQHSSNPSSQQQSRNPGNPSSKEMESDVRNDIDAQEMNMAQEKLDQNTKRNAETRRLARIPSIEESIPSTYIEKQRVNPSVEETIPSKQAEAVAPVSNRAAPATTALAAVPAVEPIPAVAPADSPSEVSQLDSEKP